MTPEIPSNDRLATLFENARVYGDLTRSEQGEVLAALKHLQAENKELKAKQELLYTAVEGTERERATVAEANAKLQAENERLQKELEDLRMPEDFDFSAELEP